jgi:hypothetical protein
LNNGRGLFPLPILKNYLIILKFKNMEKWLVIQQIKTKVQILESNIMYSTNIDDESKTKLRLETKEIMGDLDMLYKMKYEIADALSELSNKIYNNF